MMDHSQQRDDATISSILGTLFSERSDQEPTTMVSERADKEAIATVPARLDEEMFEPLVEQGEIPSIPTKEELVKYPELEYSSREVQAIVDKMDKAQKQEFRKYEQYFLTRYRQIGNMQPLYLENKEHSERNVS